MLYFVGLILICLFFVLILATLIFIAFNNKREHINLRGKHVVITGGSSGIGWELSIKSFEEGANVSIVARNKDRLNQIKTELENLKKSNVKYENQIIQIESVDISNNYQSTKAAFDKLTEKAGPIDVLINNAGIFKCTEFSETDIKDFEDMMRVNYLGAVYCTKAVIDSMKSRNFGRIVFVSSQAGQIGIFGYTAYSPTKFALRGLAESLQMELKPYNVYVTLSYPPDTQTPGLEQENINKPEETRIIAEGSGVLSAEEVASGIISSLKTGSFSCVYGINGHLLSIITCGAAPITSLLEGLIQIIGLPLSRLIALFLLLNFDSIVKKCHKKKQRK